MYSVATGTVGVALARSTGNTWTGTIAASSALGNHPVSVVALDAAGNSTTDTSASYKTAQVVGTTGGSISDAIMSAACGQYLFALWGKATMIDSSSFSIDDGSGVAITVIAPGYSGIAGGNLVRARGILNPSIPTLTSSAGLVKNY